MTEDDFEIPEGMIVHEVLGMRMVFPDGFPYEFAVATAEALVSSGVMKIEDGKLTSTGVVPEGELSAIDMTIDDHYNVKAAKSLPMDEADLTDEERAAIEAKAESLRTKSTKH